MAGQDATYNGNGETAPEYGFGNDALNKGGQDNTNFGNLDAKCHDNDAAEKADLGYADAKPRHDDAPNTDSQDKADLGYVDAKPRDNEATPENGPGQEPAPEPRNVRRAFPRRGSCTKHTLEAAARANHETEIIVLCAAAEAEHQKAKAIENIQLAVGNHDFDDLDGEEGDDGEAIEKSRSSGSGTEPTAGSSEAEEGDDGEVITMAGPEAGKRDETEQRKAKSRSSACGTELTVGSLDSAGSEGEGDEGETIAGAGPEVKECSKGKAKVSKGRKIGLLGKMRRGMNRFTCRGSAEC